LISTPLTEHECQAIAGELQDETLVACSDGVSDPSRAIASYGTVFASSLIEQRVASTVGPVDGHPNLVTSYRAELSGIIATLYLVYGVCQYYHITEGAMTLYCDSKGALKSAFHPIKAGITPYFKTDHDLIEVAKALLTLIPIVISTSWVKGHYTGKTNSTNTYSMRRQTNLQANIRISRFHITQYANLFRCQITKSAFCMIPQ
jgi:hypothetical protein